MCRPLFAIFCIIFGAGTAGGQTTATPTRAETIEVLLERIEKLETRLGELERKLGSQPAACSMPAKFSVGHSPTVHGGVPGAEAPQEPKTPTEAVVVAQEQASYPSLQVRGFADAANRRPQPAEALGRNYRNSFSFRETALYTVFW